MKITLNLNDDLCKRVDEYAKKNFLTRTSVISVATNQFLVAEETKSFYKEMLSFMKQFASSGSLTSEQVQTMEQFETMVRVFDNKF